MTVNIIQADDGSAAMVDSLTSRKIAVFDPVRGFDTSPGTYVGFEDHFLGDVIADQWSAAQGADAQGAIAAVVAGQHGGVCRLTSGDAGTGTAADGSVLTQALNWIPASGPLYMEARVRLNSAVTNVCVNIGFTDVLATTTLEMPFTVSGTTITSNATDAACFVFDTAQTTDVFNILGVKNNTDTALTAATGALVPVADSWFTLGVFIDTSGNATFFHNGANVGRVANAVTASVALTPVLAIETRTTATRQLDIDYVRVASLVAA